MQRKQAHVVIGFLIAVMICLIGGFGASGISAHASTVSVSGLGENDATITDSSGKTIPNGSDLSKWDNYEVHYQWGIPDGEPIQAGDTVTVNLPQNAVGFKDISFPLYDDNGAEIGTFSIAEGATTGTITFNDALASTATNREGTLQFYVKGTQENENVGLDWGINKIGWVSGHNSDGTPSQLTWNIAFNPNSTHLGETVITDNLGPGQTYIPGSVQASTGKFDANGNFVGDGNSLTPSVDASGNTVIFTFDDVTTAVNMTYHTKPDVSGTSGIWKNSASLNGQNVGSSIAWGGTGSGNGNGNEDDNNTTDENLGNVKLTKTDAATGKALAGAIYELQDANGNVLEAGLKTDAEGVLTCSNLAAGHYQFVETQAPEGYALNTEPLPFDITAGSSATVSVSAKDAALSGGSTTPENPENPENPGTTTPPTTPTEPENPENPGTTTPPTTPTEPENPGTTTPPTTPTEPENPENPGTTTPPTTPTEPENPENPGTTTPTTPTEPENPENPGTTTPTTPTEPENPETGTTTPTTPAEPETPGSSENPSVTSPNNSGMNPSSSNGGSGDNGSGQTTGASGASTNGAGTSSASDHYASGKLPQTGEHKTGNHILTLAGFVLLFASLGLWYHERHA